MGPAHSGDAACPGPPCGARGGPRPSSNTRPSLTHLEGHVGHGLGQVVGLQAVPVVQVLPKKHAHLQGNWQIGRGGVKQRQQACHGRAQAVPCRGLCPRPARALCPARPVPCCRPISTYSTQGLDGGRWSDSLARENRPLPVTGRVVARGASASRLSLSSVMGTSVSHETCLMEQLEKRDSFPGPRPRKPDLEMPGTLGRQQPWEFLPGSATAAASCPVSPKWPTAVHPANNLAVAGSPPGVALHTHKRGCARAVLGKQWNLRGS